MCKLLVLSSKIKTTLTTFRSNQLSRAARSYISQSAAESSYLPLVERALRARFERSGTPQIYNLWGERRVLSL